MRAALIVSGVLGVGTALTFGAALTVATLFPGGTLLSSNANSGDCNAMGARGLLVSCVAPGGVRLGPAPVFLGGGGGVCTTSGDVTTCTSNAAPADGSAPATPAPTTEASPSG